jgi:hypothetical protein
VLIDHLRGSTTAEPSFLKRLRQLSPRTRIILLSDRPSDLLPHAPESPEEAVQWIPGPVQGSTLLDALDRAAQAVPPIGSGQR